MISNVCVYAERIYVEYLGARLLNMERIICRCEKIIHDEVERERCNSCVYAQIYDEEELSNYLWRSKLESNRE